MKQAIKKFFNKGISTPIAVIIIILCAVLVGGIVVWQYFGMPKVEISRVTILEEKEEKTIRQNYTNLFFARQDKGIEENLFRLAAVLYDTENREVIKSISIELISNEGELAPSSYTAWGHNNSVQYNPNTKSVIFMTESLMGYEGCYGTCDCRFHLINLEDKKIQELIYKTDNLIGHWVVNPNRNSIILASYPYKDYEINSQNLFEIDLQNKEIRKIATVPWKKHHLPAELKISKDGKYIYQAIKESIDGRWTNEILLLNKINITTGEIFTQEIYRGQAIEFETTNLSPDETKFAFYADTQLSSKRKLFIKDFQNDLVFQIPHTQEISNLNLYWSGDSDKLLYISGTRNYYDFDTNKSVELPIGTFPLVWAASENFIAFCDSHRLGIYNVNSGEIFFPEEDIFKESCSYGGGAFWF